MAKNIFKKLLGKKKTKTPDAKQKEERPAAQDENKADKSVKSLVIPTGTERIASNAYFGLSELFSIVIPESVKVIEANAFACDSSLNRITYLGTKAGWKAIRKEINWDFDTGEYSVVCIDGEIKK